MANQITWGKDQRDYSAEMGLTLFAIGIDGRQNKACKTGQWIQTGLMTDENARFLFLFGQHLKGASPKKAFDEAAKVIKRARKASAVQEVGGG